MKIDKYQCFFGIRGAEITLCVHIFNDNKKKHIEMIANIPLFLVAILPLFQIVKLFPKMEKNAQNY